MQPATKIAELREAKGLTQLELAEYLEVSVPTIQNWERERTSSRQFMQFIKLCQILQCVPDELVGLGRESEGDNENFS